MIKKFKNDRKISIFFHPSLTMYRFVYYLVYYITKHSSVSSVGPTIKQMTSPYNVSTENRGKNNRWVIGHLWVSQARRFCRW